jgi:hypothetical protein
MLFSTEVSTINLEFDFFLRLQFFDKSSDKPSFKLPLATRNFGFKVSDGF